MSHVSAQHFITADINAVKNVMIVKFKGRLVPWEKDDTYTYLFYILLNKDYQ